jgi:hypothetical protein
MPQKHGKRKRAIISFCASVATIFLAKPSRYFATNDTNYLECFLCKMTPKHGRREMFLKKIQIPYFCDCVAIFFGEAKLVFCHRKKFAICKSSLLYLLNIDMKLTGCRIVVESEVQRSLQRIAGY